ncbi:hypothetical protein GCM10010106_01890 [Thermopolyspora flexuosa]|nr:hypothetical protein GCM10010106_01890 [Thermopolyspora flexuosa]
MLLADDDPAHLGEGLPQQVGVGGDRDLVAGAGRFGGHRGRALSRGGLLSVGSGLVSRARGGGAVPGALRDRFFGNGHVVIPSKSRRTRTAVRRRAAWQQDPYPAGVLSWQRAHSAAVR